MDQLNKALNTTTSSGAALLPESLEPGIIEYLGRYKPLYMAMAKKVADSKTHEYVRRTALPNAWVEGETTPSNASNSTYVRESVQLKILRAWGSVAGFQQRMSEKFVDALTAEIMGNTESLADLIEQQILWGNDADAYQFSGFDTFLSEDTTARASINSGGRVADLNATITLSDLDDMLDATESFRGGNSDPKMFVASPQLISKISGLQTRIQRTVNTVEFPGGFRMDTYRGVPLMPSTIVRPVSTTTSPTVTATAAAGGSLADDEYFYAISSVTALGEQIVGTEDSATTATTNNSVTLTWTADANARLYKVWRGTATGVWTLLDVIAAKTYDSSGTVSGTVATYTDDGSKTTVDSIYPLESGEETMFLVNMNPMRGSALVGNISPLGERVDNFITYTPLATVKSSFDFMIETFTALMVPNPTLHAVARRVRL